MKTRCLWATAVAGAVLLEYGIRNAECGMATATRPRPVRFVSVEVSVDSGAAPLAVYQVELTAKGADAKIVGIEGGAHAAFREPAYYDPAALAGGRIILAAFSTGRDLPAGKTRVATVTFQVSGAEQPTYHARLIVAATADGKKVPAEVSVSPGKGEDQ
jgi:hypothetical protein